MILRDFKAYFCIYFGAFCTVICTVGAVEHEFRSFENHIKSPQTRINTDDSKRACRGRHALLEKVFCYLWGSGKVAKNWYTQMDTVAIYKGLRAANRVKKLTQVYSDLHNFMSRLYSNLYSNMYSIFTHKRIIRYVNQTSFHNTTFSDKTMLSLITSRLLYKCLVLPYTQSSENRPDKNPAQPR